MIIQNTNLEIIDVTIPNTQQASAIITQGDRTLVGISTPAAIDGTQLSFRIATSETSIFKSYHNAAGTEVFIEMGVDRHIGIEATDFSGTQYFKLFQVTPATADRTYQLIFKGISGA